MMQRVVGLEPGNVDHYRRLARLYKANGEKALQEYQRLVALRPDAEIFYYLGEHFRQAGDPLRALGYYRRAVQLRPDHAGFRQALDNLEKRLRNPRPP
jgi:tetratricopeptide (TPR) repeat protein